MKRYPKDGTLAPVDADLAAVVEAWLDLTADIRKMIVGVVKLAPKKVNT